MWTAEEWGSIVGQYVSKLAAARRRRDRGQPPYPHDNEILEWSRRELGRDEPQNLLPPLLAVGRWVTLDELQKVYGLKTRKAAGMVVANLRTRRFEFEKGGNGRWRLTCIPRFRKPKNVPVFIRRRVAKSICMEPGITGQELEGRQALMEGQVRSAVDGFRECKRNETVTGQYQPGFKVVPTRASDT